MKKYLNKQNVTYSQTRDMYFYTKQKEKKLEYENLVYVSFKTKDGGSENMWVQIIEGNQKKGYGIVDNFPVEEIGYDFDDKVYYETHDDGITRPYQQSQCVTIH